MSPRGIVLVGAGVVGRAILKAHIDAGISVVLIDQDGQTIRAAVDELRLGEQWSIGESQNRTDSLTSVSIRNRDEPSPQSTLVIESIAERLDVKQSFFADAEKIFGSGAVFTSNTSTLRIDAIASALRHPSRFAGMHFFMPVVGRPAVEVVRGQATSEATIEACQRHVRRLGKEALVVGDSPGFIVNRLLSPYLNQAMLLLCGGVSADRIEQAAITYGMPMSPLELIDHIGARTMFDAGRVYWQSFPNRIDPAPILGKLIKLKRLGRSVGAGFFDYSNHQRSRRIADPVQELVQIYHRPMSEATDENILHLLAVPMWIEASIAFEEGTVQSWQQFDLAMRGGLGYAPDKSWIGFFRSLGHHAIVESIDRWKTQFKSMDANAVNLRPFASHPDHTDSPRRTPSQ